MNMVGISFLGNTDSFRPVMELFVIVILSVKWKLWGKKYVSGKGEIQNVIELSKHHMFSWNKWKQLCYIPAYSLVLQLRKGQQV